ncbi:hypothetical protein [Paraburkholderia saeva]|uniref:Uncharacterized protein n=1 Tax=Paraburkholderia saeva TaxID=2777537 RepID=A0A9N8S368_9BURK|nr:hypothetical protein [Paraburkholderia saeva]CAG4928345.1 hypothetical protein LMG31841_05810 [Paraburkholderia saeva]
MTPENSEDVSYGYVPGSIGTPGTFFVEWAPRATPASDRARREAMAALAPILKKHRRQATPKRAHVAPAEFQRARAQHIKG